MRVSRRRADGGAVDRGRAFSPTRSWCVRSAGSRRWPVRVALAIIMIPLVTRTTEEMMLLVPHELREASLALGVPRWRTTLSVVARTAIGGIATGVILAIARSRGRDRAAAVHGIRQSLLVDLADQSDLLADGAGLYLRDFAFRRLAAPGVGRCAGADGDRSRTGVGRKMGDAGSGASRHASRMADKLVVTSSERLFRQESRASTTSTWRFAENRVDGDHRTVGMRQVDPRALPQPDA